MGIREGLPNLTWELNDEQQGAHEEQGERKPVCKVPLEVKNLMHSRPVAEV